MIVYRLAGSKYANDMSGEGASLYGGRWNPVGIKALYASQNISLCILEILARTQKKINPPGYQLITIDLPEGNMASIEPARLKIAWKQHVEYTQWIGEEFLTKNKLLIMKVPSAIVDKENNFLINPFHKDFNRMKTINMEDLDLDRRLNQI